jgi:uncharacterized protein (DUF1697 family)
MVPTPLRLHNSTLPGPSYLYLLQTSAMTKYIAFLRAINVGGRTVKMDLLKQHFAMPGFKNIATYIQSGNVVFEHASGDVNALTKKIETKLLKELGYEVKTLLKTVPDLEAVIKNNPFKKHADDMSLYVTFLSAMPDATLVKQLLALQTAYEQFQFVGAEVYVLVKKGGYGESKFSNNFMEKKLKLDATTRNWATINKMLTL